MDLEAGKGLWTWYNGLPSVAKTIMSLFVMITAPAVFIIVTEIRNPKVVTNAEFEHNVMSRLDDMQHQITAGNLLNQHNFIIQKRSIDSIAKGLSGNEAVIKDLSIITIANSNDKLFDRLVPYLNRIEDNTYKTIVQLQKQELMKRLDSASIQMRKVKKE